MAHRQDEIWQTKLEALCKSRNIHPPVYQIMSDRRGGRTAWSASVTADGNIFRARYWYDGQYVNNAREDCAQIACIALNPPSLSSSALPEGASAEEEKKEPENEPLPKGAIAEVGADILD